MPELEFATVPELVEELRKRARISFIALRPLDDREFNILFNYKGDLDETLGMVERVRYLIVRDTMHYDKGESVDKTKDEPDEEHPL